MQRGGKRAGAGKPKGKQHSKTLEQKAVADAFNQRVMKSADKLFNAQLSLAVGSVRVFEVQEVGTGKDKKRVHNLVTDVVKIKKVLDETDGGGGTTIDNTYYFVQNVPPDNKAIDSMLNRALGKPKESMDVTSNGKDVLQSITVNVIKTIKKNGHSN